ncbi:MAG: hypothetical protein NTX64_11320 [Elusimicrobia bacterium]|nr:hypothetical protein [Elusimicrobiota bacterium]
MTDPAPERVGSGVFRIDRRRAFELLSRYQLSSPFHFVLAWMRAAAAAGATAVEVDDGPRGFELRFDGRPFAPAELSELLARLPEEACEPRLKELARGALAALRAGALEVSVASGPAGARSRLKLDADGETIEDWLAEGEMNEVRACWPGSGRPPGFDEAMRALKESCLPGLARSARGGEGYGRLPPGAWEPFAAEGRSGWVAQGWRGEDTELHLYHFRVACGICELRLSPAAPEVRAVVDDPALRLDLGGTAAVRDERFEALTAALRSPAEAFALAHVRTLARVLPAMGDSLRDPELYARWKVAVAGRADPEGMAGVLLDLQRQFALDAGAGAGGEGLVERWGQTAGWLRDTALRIFGDGRPPGTELEDALWRAPLYFTVEGLPQSVEELERLRLRFGRLSVGERKFSGEPWSPSAVEVRDRRDMLERLAGPLGDRLGS